MVLSLPSIEAFYRFFFPRNPSAMQSRTSINQPLPSPDQAEDELVQALQSIHLSEPGLRPGLANYYPNIIPIELYILAREPAEPIPAHLYKDFPQVQQIQTEVLEPVRQDLAEMLFRSLGERLRDATFEWIPLRGRKIIPCLFVYVLQDTVLDWAMLEGDLRGILGKSVGKRGIAVDVKFKIVSK